MLHTLTDSHLITGCCSYPVFSSDEVSLVHDEQADVLDVLPLLPASRQDVPFVWCADDDVTFSQELQICAGFTRQQHHLFIQDVLELLVPVDKHLRDKDERDYVKQEKEAALGLR